jgi:hypothetical protein
MEKSSESMHLQVYATTKAEPTTDNPETISANQ